MVHGYELTFHGEGSAVATVEPLQGGRVPVLLWSLEPKDELALDRYEGFPYLYRRENMKVEMNGRTVEGMVYIMNGGHPFGTPSGPYLKSIRDGYRTAGFDQRILTSAVEKSTRLSQEQRPKQSSLFEFRW